MHRDRERLLNREIDPVADFCIGRSWFLGDFIWVLFYGCVERPLEFSLDVRVNFQRAHFPRSQRCLYPFSFFLIVFVLILLLLLFSYNRHRGIGGNRGLAPDSDCGIFVYADIDDSRGFLRLRSIFRRFFFCVCAITRVRQWIDSSASTEFATRCDGGFCWVRWFFGCRCCCCCCCVWFFGESLWDYVDRLTVQVSSRCEGTSPRSRSQRPYRPPLRRDRRRGCRDPRGYLKDILFRIFNAIAVRCGKYTKKLTDGSGAVGIKFWAYLWARRVCVGLNTEF